MESPLIVVTGPIASGKSLVARVLAERGGALIDADELAHEAFEDPSFARSLRAAFGPGVLAGDRVSRMRLAGVVFAEQRALDRLNRLIRPYVKRIVGERISSLRGQAPYIVLDALLFFQYKFRFKPDLSVRTDAPEEVRVRRMMRRDGFTRAEALQRIERQRSLSRDWERADLKIDTDAPIGQVRAEAARLRDEFLDGRSRKR
ncbi:MAG: dephospho-CoA kinase [Candidatus Krumholzibacteria bacterium]|nr:dephospho-CoA kinase [Candidatus Krumholzibacteria bacterium]